VKKLKKLNCFPRQTGSGSQYSFPFLFFDRLVLYKKIITINITIVIVINNIINATLPLSQWTDIVIVV